MAKQHLPKEKDDSIRLDKWLWAARFYKTRTIAKEMIDGGKVHYNNQRTKPNKTVEIGAILKLRQGSEEKEVEVLALSAQRCGAPEAQLLYRETARSVEQRRKWQLHVRIMHFLCHTQIAVQIKKSGEIY